MSVEILYEDNHLLVLNKPAGLPTMGVAEHEESLVTRAKAYLKEKYNKPGNVYVGVVSRLDARATGAIVLARTSKAAARLTEQFKVNQVEKTYLAFVSGVPQPASGSCRDWVYKDDRQQRMFVGRDGTPGAQEARLSYKTRLRLALGTLLEVQLETGRKHQIRLQLSQRGHPIWGDAKYESRESFSSGIALHSWLLSFEHPTTKAQIKVVAPIPPAWRTLGVSEKSLGT